MITEKESQFINFLRDDFKQLKEKSILNIVFDSAPYDNEKQKLELLALSQYTYLGKVDELISESQLLLKGDFSSYIGKYTDYFWLITEDGEITFLGTEISKLPLILSGDLFEYYSTSNFDELEFLLNNKGCSVAQFESILERYIALCKKHGFSFSLDEPLYSQKDFEDFTSIMEKYK
ncbi:hypothetical protein [Serratia sp. Se-RSBMAAmG]|uniref:hypothetical protein n=1 Tax=Serratia sp. Se-RSBMAAmG TaxID=3043305 RepID=UPI0024AEB203|nr:hypothetical protein [Serratia sp. Se-RSBMAAmG]MDI6976212.1 hypothetical protein [Serratia sp. Se-RSBMAAmG]